MTDDVDQHQAATGEGEVVASLDAELAVSGVLDALHQHALVPDEAWVAERLP